MNEETTQQSEAPVESQATPNESSPQTTLEDIAKKYSIEEQTKTFTAKPEQTVQSQPIDHRIPDPVINPDEFTRYQLNQAAAVNKTMAELSQNVQQMRAAQEQERLNAEVSKAVAKVNEKLKVDPMYAEILLEKKYRDDPVFKRIWDNRYSNPKALDEALDVIATGASGVFQARADAQLIENQRAAKTSQRAMATTSRSANDEWDNLSDAEFERKWHSTKGY